MHEGWQEYVQDRHVCVYTCSCQHSLQTRYPLQWLISLKAICWLLDLYTCVTPQPSAAIPICFPLSSTLSILSISAGRQVLNK